MTTNVLAKLCRKEKCTCFSFHIEAENNILNLYLYLYLGLFVVVIWVNLPRVVIQIRAKPVIKLCDLREEKYLL